jgi:hypothetical protein
MKKAPHPPHSLDLAPSDFYLFGPMTRCLAGLSLENPDGFLHGIQGFLTGVQKVTLQAVFLEWMRRRRQCIDTDGEYIDETRNNDIGRRTVIQPRLRCSCLGGTPCIFIFSSKL